jgi:hypothetical protein
MIAVRISGRMDKRAVGTQQKKPLDRQQGKQQ